MRSVGSGSPVCKRSDFILSDPYQRLLAAKSPEKEFSWHRFSREGRSWAGARGSRAGSADWDGSLSVLGEHGSFSLAEPCWSLSMERLMLSLSLLALRMTANDCRRMDSSSCLSWAQAFHPAETREPPQVTLPAGSWPCRHCVGTGTILQPSGRAESGAFWEWAGLEIHDRRPGMWGSERAAATGRAFFEEGSMGFVPLGFGVILHRAASAGSAVGGAGASREVSALSNQWYC